MVSDFIILIGNLRLLQACNMVVPPVALHLGKSRQHAQWLEATSANRRKGEKYLE